ncbi:LLM class flavin-dependent oxidoreductase [Nocardioides sp. W7]|uniref:LLM class flavin-dependent oxidoreductase n=1 Tax=Nocardioides sp. W7 TaxID=2931390 RepID=UPI001FD426B3|nr:LLM class flavin-dependent oxidoreductase [Nocardioides sp. W7]
MSSTQTQEISFGFGMVTAQRDPRDQRSDADLYADVLDLCVHAEELGFDSAWLSEHHFVDDGYMPSLLTVAAAIAARTSTLRIATGILVAPLHDPVRLAEDAATVDLLSRGRLLLGVGAGYRDEEFAGLGRSKEGLGATMDHVLSTLRDAWGDGTVQTGPASVPVRVTPKPFRSGGPEVWIGARTRAGIRRTARAADGLLAARVTPDELAVQVAMFTEEVRVRGRDLDEVSVGVHCPVLAWTDGDAWPVLEPHLHYSEWKYRDMTGEPFGGRSGGPGLPPSLTEEVRDRLRAGALVGTPDEVASAVRAYHEAAGDLRFTFIPRLYWPGMEPAVQREAMRVFAEEVIPRVRAR